MNEVGEGQLEEQPNQQPGGEECQGGAYGVSLGTYGGPVASVSQQENQEGKPEEVQELLGQASQWVRIGKAGKPLRKSTGNDRCKRSDCNGDCGGSLHLLLVVLVTALISNAGQYLWEGPSLFGGLSGVLYGLLGYLWVFNRLAPAPVLALPKGVIGFMLAWR